MRSPWGEGSRVAARPPGADHGSVTAEFAALLPAVVLVLALCLGAIQLVGQQLRLSDAAADAARAAARGDDAARVIALVARAVPGTSVSVEENGEFVCADLNRDAGFGIAGLGLRLSASACALGGGL